ncbi:Ldh family oxidoreductase [Microvirga massiliensis]|uniref:Ldh family oxidoreductase n=1 Tax=Microvirga massiliensis TaxID=1033741 RepID=UPI00062B569B|nr:Ldh family oxidoreductase [Microvirga massiliensis]
MPVVTIPEAESLVFDALVRCRTSDKNARSVARALVAAEADGLKGHGLSRVATYAAQARVGKIDGFATPTFDRPRPAIVAIDAGYGFAFPALDLALSVLPDVAREQGLAAAPIRRSHHCGAAGHPVEQLADRGLVGLLFANTPAAMAPWGGSVGIFGTNPIAFACPLPRRAPIVIDLSLSKVARGNILAAKQRGESIPEGWALDAAGRSTTDPDEALGGTMVPLGDAKGTALALMVELLAAGLTGARFASEASSFLDDKGDPPGTGQLLLAFDPVGLGGEEALARCAMLAEAIEGQAGARLPGSRRLELRRKAQEAGLDVTDQLLASIRALS